MDTRVALKRNSKLYFYNQNQGLCLYTIEKEIARGASCIVYEASYLNNSQRKKYVRIKECYPFSLNITRTTNHELLASNEDQDVFEESKKRMKQAFDLGNDLFHTSGLTNYVTNTVDIYEYHNSVYIVSAYQEGFTLSYERFDCLKDCIKVVKSCANVIHQIHEKGYLYLDLKPENIFVLTGTTDMVQLFDFDSLIPISQKKETIEECRIAYTQGYSGYELQMGALHQIGKHSDVYAIGAILFYLLFQRNADALDCEEDAKYDYSQSKYFHTTYQDELYYELDDFFHNTLSNYYLDRYSDMTQVIQKLEKIELQSDCTRAFIQNATIISPKLFVGRKEEEQRLYDLLQQYQQDIIVLCGMGGMGKTSLVNHVLSKMKSYYQHIVYIQYQGSIVESIIDDQQFYIHTIQKHEKERIDEYYQRKLQAAKQLSSNQNNILVIDNYTFQKNEDFSSLKQLGWTILLVTREKNISKEYRNLTLDAIQEKESLYTLVQTHLRRKLNQEEYSIVDQLIAQVEGHTLALELIAKQIKNSYMTLPQALQLLQQHGLSHLGRESILYQKDDQIINTTIANVIDSLLDRVFTSRNTMVLQMIAYVQRYGIGVHTFATIYGLKNKDVINELVNEGWIHVQNEEIRMHPLICEVLLHREVDDAFIKKMQGVFQKVRAWNDYALNLSIIRSCTPHRTLTNTYSYEQFVYETLLIIPRQYEKEIEVQATTLLQKGTQLSELQRLCVYEKLMELYQEQNKHALAYQVLVQMKSMIHEDYSKGLYYNMWGGYYDVILHGNYRSRDREDRKYLSLIHKYINRSYFYMKRSKQRDYQTYCGEFLRQKANIWIRSKPNYKIRIYMLMKKCEQIMISQHLEYSEYAYALYLTYAWYYTYVNLNKEYVYLYLSKARTLVYELHKDVLDQIDCYYIPCANILLEIDEFEDSIACLQQAISYCEQYKDVIPYIRKKQELYGYLQEVYTFAEYEEEG